MSRLPVVAIVGRPNVGKSTLFNRLARRRIALVDDEPGVTRDRLYSMARPEGFRFHLIDTGGLDPDSKDVFFMGMKEQARMAMEEADCVILLADARAGLHPDDRYVANLLRTGAKPTVIAANKIDGKTSGDLLPEFYELGLEHVFPISATHNIGVLEMIGSVMGLLSPELKKASVDQATFEDSQPKGRAAKRVARVAEEEAAAAAALEAGEEAAPDLVDEPESRADEVFLPKEIRVAVVGKPNAGKSSLINAVLGEPRLLVSEIAGTTRDAVDTKVEFNGRTYRVIDTAGIRRKRSVASKLEKYSVVAALRAIEDAHIAVLVIDGWEGVTDQDAKIAEIANERGKAMIVVVNKWDLVQDGADDRMKYAARVRKELGFIGHAPVVFMSALHNRGVDKLLPTCEEVARHHHRRIGTGPLNKALQHALESHNLPSFRGRRVSIYYATQVAIAPPTMVVAVNNPEGIHFSYRRFLLNSLRDSFNFIGTPTRLIFRRRGKDIGTAGHSHKKRQDPTKHG